MGWDFPRSYDVERLFCLALFARQLSTTPTSQAPVVLSSRVLGDMCNTGDSSKCCMFGEMAVRNRDS